MSHWTAKKWQRALAANATDTSFPSLVPTATEPTGDGVFDLTKGDGLPAYSSMSIIPFGTDAENEVFDLKVTLWSPTFGSTGVLWVPSPFLVVTATLGNIAGVAGTDVNASQFFADTLAVVLEGLTNADTTDDGSLVITSPADDTIARVDVFGLMMGFWKAQLTFDMAAVTGAASGNALVKFSC